MHFIMQAETIVQDLEKHLAQRPSPSGTSRGGGQFWGGSLILVFSAEALKNFSDPRNDLPKVFRGTLYAQTHPSAQETNI